MKISLRWCPTCKKPTIQAKRKDGIGKVLWYCPHCGVYNRDSFISAEHAIVSEASHFRLSSDWGKESDISGER